MKFGYTIVYVSSVSDALAFYDKAFRFQTRFLHESGSLGLLLGGRCIAKWPRRVYRARQLNSHNQI